MDVSLYINKVKTCRLRIKIAKLRNTQDLVQKETHASTKSKRRPTPPLDPF